MKSGVVFLVMLVLLSVGHYTSRNDVRVLTAALLVALGVMSVVPGFLR